MATYLGDAGNSRISLSAVLVGTIITLGLMVLFSLLGLSIGVASLESLGSGLGIGAAIYIIVTQLVSLAVGGFAAARLLDTYDLPAAGLAGVSVWALSSLIIAFGGVNTGTSFVNSTASLASQTAQTGADAVAAVTPDDIQLPDISQIAGNVSLSDLPPEVQQALEDADVTPSQLRRELGEAYRNVVSQQEMARARSILTSTLADVIAQPASFQSELNSAIDRLVEGEDAVFSEEDLTEAENTLQRRLDLSDSDIEQIATTVRTQFDEAVETLRQTVNDLQQTLLDAADRLQSTVSSAALWLSIASLLGLLAAGGAGAAGRRT